MSCPKCVVAGAFCSKTSKPYRLYVDFKEEKISLPDFSVEMEGEAGLVSTILDRVLHDMHSGTLVMTPDFDELEMQLSIRAEALKSAANSLRFDAGTCHHCGHPVNAEALAISIAFLQDQAKAALKLCGITLDE